jgi:hypothetical protein
LVGAHELMHGLFLYISGMKYFLYVYYRFFAGNLNEWRPYYKAVSTLLIPTILYVWTVASFIYPPLFVKENKGMFLSLSLVAYVVGYLAFWLSIKPSSLDGYALQQRYRRAHSVYALLYVIAGIAVFVARGIYCSENH